MRLQLALLCLSAACASSTATKSPSHRPTQVGVDTLTYSDTDNTIVATVQASAKHEFDEEGTQVEGGVLIDAISSASADVISNATPSFTEGRAEVHTSGSYAIGKVVPSAGYRFSYEEDYIPMGEMSLFPHQFALPIPTSPSGTA